MTGHDLNAVLGFIHKVSDGPELSDRQLLQRFTADGDQAAFAAVVRRHGPLVLDVCRRRLRHVQDAEDAFQAVFLVLAKKARAGSWQESVAGWLHEVACRVSAEARGRQARRRSREKQMNEVLDRAAPTIPELPDVLTFLDEELRRLPEKYRVPLLLCCLEGRTREEAAELLGWSPGAVKGRLERGREMLRLRLARRGVAPALLPVAAPSVGVDGMAARAVELAAAVRTGVAVTGPAADLANATLSALLRTRLRSASLVLLAAVLFGAGATAWRPGPVPAADDREPEGAAAVVPPAPAVPPEELVARPQSAMKHRGPVRAVTFLPDGKRTVSSSFDGTVSVWDVARGYQFRNWLTDARGTAVAVSPDGKLVVVGTDKGELIGWDLATAEERFARLTHQENIYALAFAPDGKLLAAANHTGTITVHVGADGRRLRRCVGHAGRVWSIAFAPDGKTLASAGEDGTVRLWDPSSGKQTRLLGSKKGDVYGVTFRPDGGRLAALGDDGVVRFWSTPTGEAAGSLEAGGGQLAAYSPDGKWLAVAGTKETILWEPEKGKKLAALRGHEGKVHGLAFSPDGSQLATSGEDGAVLVWNFQKKAGGLTAPAP